MANILWGMYAARSSQAKSHDEPTEAQCCHKAADTGKDVCNGGLKPGNKTNNAHEQGADEFAEVLTRNPVNNFKCTAGWFKHTQWEGGQESSHHRAQGSW